ncbi:MAG: PulJ/GspJ family protein [Methylobacter sp.]
MTIRYRSQLAFTLIEIVMLIVIISILFVLAGNFVTPVRGYFDALARAELSDIADTAMRRMARELQAALPNSVRVSGSYIEFLPTVTGGRYRKQQDCSGVCTGDVLNFTSSDISFDVIGSLLSVPAAGQEVAIYNTSPDMAFSGTNVATLTSGGGCTLSVSKICFSAGMTFPFESPAQRFQIISSPVTFACVGSTLWRYSGYARQAAQPTNVALVPLATATSITKLATHVDCASSSFVYIPGTTQRADLVVMSLTITNSSDSVNLLHQVHVQNVP